MSAALSWVGRQLRVERRALIAYLVLAGSLVTNLVMRQISGMLSRIEFGGESASMSVLTGPHLGIAPLTNAGRSWALSGAERQVADLIELHLLVDMVFIPFYGWLLWRLLRRAAGTEKPSARWMTPLVLWTLGADVLENMFTWGFARSVDEQQTPSDDLAGALVGATWTKWLLVAAVLVCATRLWYERRTETTRVRIWRRHRVQIGVVAVLTVLVAMPGGGPLDQLPDILRTFTDANTFGRPLWGELWPSFLTLLLLCLALEVAGRWALLDGYSERAAPTKSRVLLGLALATAIVAWCLRTWGLLDLTFSRGVFALPVVLGTLAFLAVPFVPQRLRERRKVDDSTTSEDPEQSKDPNKKDPEKQVDLPGNRRDNVLRAGRLLAALPVTIAGMGLLRAYTDPLLGGEKTATGPSHLFFWIGVTTVMVVTPLFYFVLAALERVLFGDCGGDGPASTKRAAAVHLLGAGVLVIAVSLSIWTFADPLTAGPWLNGYGSMTLFLALVAVVAGWLQRRTERRMPYAPTARLWFTSRSPVFVGATAVFVLAGLLNTEGGYHSVRLTGDSAEPANFSARDGFTTWLADARGCPMAEEYKVAEHPAVPLVLVAAPGGGIRAAYWTERALEVMEGTGACARRRVFATSSVSGGSLGVVAHYAHPAGDSGNHVGELSREKPLATSMAATLFRDLPAGALGIRSGWADRAALLEEAWSSIDTTLGSTHLVGGLAPGDDGHDGWRPLILLNGTEVSTGCRMLVSALPVVASTPAGAPTSCLSNTAVGRGSADQNATSTGIRASEDKFVHGGVDFLEFRDDRRCGATLRDQDVRAVTAALLSARFPYVSPSGELFRCQRLSVRGQVGAELDDSSTEEKPVRAADLDGGAAENSGLASVLDLWQALEPIVAEHNRCVLSEQPKGCNQASPVVIPLLVLVDNHYATTVGRGPVPRQRELSAPLQLRGAAGTLANQGVLEQQALLTFSGPAPGLTGKDGPVRFFHVGPTMRPGVAAPLGWTLSDMTRTDLYTQLRQEWGKGCRHTLDQLVPQPLGCYLNTVRVKPPS